jgi:hypothetical protein
MLIAAVALAALTPPGKLREGVVASNRIDAFAIEGESHQFRNTNIPTAALFDPHRGRLGVASAVSWISSRVPLTPLSVFESSACLSLLARNHAQLLSSLSGLVPGLYQAYDELQPERYPSSKGKSKDDDPQRGTDVDTLVDGVSGLRLGDRRAHFASMLLLYHLAHTGSTATFHSVLQDLTAPTTQRLQRPFDDVINIPPSAPVSSGSSVSSGSPPRAFLRREDLWYPIRAAQALAQETFSPIRFFRLVRDQRASPYERAMLSWATDRVRERAWVVMRRAYIEVGMEWAGGSLGLERAAVGPWVEQRGGRVDVGKIKLR